MRSITSSASLPSDAGGLRAARYVHLGMVARLSRLRFPDGRDGDIALGLALARAVATPPYHVDDAEAQERKSVEYRNTVITRVYQGGSLGKKNKG